MEIQILNDVARRVTGYNHVIPLQPFIDAIQEVIDLEDMIFPISWRHAVSF